MPVLQYKNTKAQKSLLSIVFFLLGAYLMFPVFQKPGFGPDPSWMLGINMGFSQHMHFGKDMIFTYGPLGFLSTHMPILIPKWIYLVFDILSTIFLLCIFDDIRKNLPFHPLLSLPVVLFTMVSLADQNFDYVFLLYFASIWLYMKGEMWHMTLAGALALLAFYIKINVGLILLVIFPVMVIVQASRHYVTRWNAIKLIFIYLLAFFVFDLAIGVEPFGYIQSGIKQISGFNDAMRQNPISDHDLWYMYYAIIIMAAFVAFTIIQLWFDHFRWDYLFLFGAGSLFMFLLFKSSFTRYDEWHLPTFFVFRSLPVLLALRFLPSKNKIVMGAGLVILLIVPWKKAYVPDFLAIKPQQLKTYAQVIKDGDKALLAEINIPEYFYFPPEIKREIGGRNIDIFPYSISMLYYNGFSYHPRPVIQSYLSFNGWMDSLNADFYNGPRAPRYIMYNVNTIDNRYSLFDETQTRLSMMQNYTVVDYYFDNLILKRRDKPLAIKSKPYSKGVLKIDQTLEVPATENLLLLKTDIRYNRKGKISRLLLRAPQLYISLILEDSSRHSFRLVSTIANSGIIINKFVNGNDDLLKFQLGNTENLQRVIGVRIFSPDQEQFEQDIPYTISKLSAEKPEDYSPIDSLKKIPASDLASIKPYQARQEKLGKNILFTVYPASHDTLNFIGIRNKFTNESRLIHALRVEKNNTDGCLENTPHKPLAYCILIDQEKFNPISDELITIKKKGKELEYIPIELISK